MRVAKFLTLAVCCVLFLYSATSSAIRDIFCLEQKLWVQYPLLATHLEDIIFLGTVTQTKQSLGFVKDPIGNTYVITVGQQIGSVRAKVMQILNDQIVVADGQRFIIIK